MIASQPALSAPPGARKNASIGITVLLADDHIIFREGLRRLLEVASGLTVVGEAATGREAVETARLLQPDVVVMDIAMPQLNGIEACRRIIGSVPGIKVILLSGYSDDEFIVSAATAGARGYVMKQTSAESLVRAIHKVAHGSSFFSQPIAKRMRTDVMRSCGGNGATPATACLSSREHEVLQLVAEGATNKEIAANLTISIKTVEKHRQRLMDKLDIHSIAGLTRYAFSTRIVESSVDVMII